MEIKKILVEQEVYVASDGQEFSSKWECETHEEDLERDKIEGIAKRLTYEANDADFPSICDPIGPRHEYRWHRIESDEDLQTFCTAFTSYCRDLKDLENVRPYVDSYPDYICLVDFPHGGAEPRWVTLSYLQRRLGAFFAQFEFSDTGERL